LQAAQIELNSTVAAIAHVQICGCARLLWQKSCQVRCITDAQFFDVCRAIRIDWVWADFLCGGNVRTGNDYTVDFHNA
jgi:hypothetical protein